MCVIFIELCMKGAIKGNNSGNMHNFFYQSRKCVNGLILLNTASTGNNCIPSVLVREESVH
jgi:hypothetical protein